MCSSCSSCRHCCKLIVFKSVHTTSAWVQCTIMDPTSSEKMDGYIDVLVEKRKKKQLTPDQVLAQDLPAFQVLGAACWQL